MLSVSVLRMQQEPLDIYAETLGLVIFTKTHPVFTPLEVNEYWYNPDNSLEREHYIFIAKTAIDFLVPIFDRL